LGYTNKVAITRWRGGVLTAWLDAKGASRLQFDKDGDRTAVGRICIGKVKNVVPNIRAAFVDIGDGQVAYYSLEENRHHTLNQAPLRPGDELSHGNELTQAPLRSGDGSRSCKPQPLRGGDEILVQVTRDAAKGKAMQVSSKLTLVGRYFVLSWEPGSGKQQALNGTYTDKEAALDAAITFSSKIHDTSWKRTAATVLGEYMDPRFMLIVRTNAYNAESDEAGGTKSAVADDGKSVGADDGKSVGAVGEEMGAADENADTCAGGAENHGSDGQGGDGADGSGNPGGSGSPDGTKGRSAGQVAGDGGIIGGGNMDALLAQLRALTAQMSDILAKAPYRGAYSVLYEDLPPYLAAVRDTYAGEMGELWTDDGGIYREFTARPELFDAGKSGTKTVLYTDKDISLFTLLRLGKALSCATDRRVWLDSGAYLVIEQTEAMAVIDVNTGKYERKSKFDDTVRRVNMEAAVMVARQLRLRNLSGIIVVDFIDMERDKDRREVLATLREAVARDPVKTTVVGMTPLQLVEITRKKTRKPLAEELL
jgi:Ribonuclease G/E